MRRPASSLKDRLVLVQGYLVRIWGHQRHLSLHSLRVHDLQVAKTLECEARQDRHKTSSAKGHRSRLLVVRSLHMHNNPDLDNPRQYPDKNRARNGCGQKAATRAGQACVLVLLLHQRKVEHLLHLLVIRMAQVNSARNLSFDLRVLLSRLSRLAAGRRYQTLCSHARKARPGREVSTDLPVVLPKKGPESLLSLRRTAHRLVQPLAQLFSQTRGNDGNSSSNSSSNLIYPNTHNSPHSRLSTDHSSLFPSLRYTANNHPLRNFHPLKLRSQTAAALSNRMLTIAILQSRRVELRPRAWTQATLLQSVG